MAVGVALPDAYDSGRTGYRREKPGILGTRAVVGDLQHLDLRETARYREPTLGLGFDVAGEENADQPGFIAMLHGDANGVTDIPLEIAAEGVQPYSPGSGIGPMCCPVTTCRRSRISRWR